MLHEYLFATPYHIAYFALFYFYLIRYWFWGFPEVGPVRWLRDNLLEFIIAALAVPVIVYWDETFLQLAQAFDDPLSGEDGKPSEFFYFVSPILVDSLIATLVHWQSIKSTIKKGLKE